MIESAASVGVLEHVRVVPFAMASEHERRTRTEKEVEHVFYDVTAQGTDVRIF